MQYLSSADGPCYFTPEEKLAKKLDIKPGRVRESLLVRKVLIENLEKTGLINPTGTRKELQEQSIRLGLPIKHTNEVITEGWSGRQKGAIQILFERGWINPNFIQHYTSDGKKEKDPFQTNCNAESSSSSFPDDPTGCNYSIKSIMKLQSDFANELTLLQFHGSKLGVIIDRTPKCHPEIAGEGIEYAWALSKFFYRRSPICHKRTKAKFRSLVNDATSHSTVLSIQRIRGCSKKARCYMKMYKSFESVELGPELTNEKHSIMESAIKFYTKMKRTGKTHRSVCDRNVADVNEIARRIPLNINSRSKSDENHSDHGRIKSEIIGVLVNKMTIM